MIDIGERAVLSVLVQRGGKLPEWKRVNGALVMFDGGAAILSPAPGIEFDGDCAWLRGVPQLVRQFNSATIGDLVGRGLARRRVDRVRKVRVVEITDAGRKALAEACLP